MKAIDRHAAGVTRPEANAQRVGRLKPAGTVRISGTSPALGNVGGLHPPYAIAPVSGLIGSREARR